MPSDTHSTGEKPPITNCHAHIFTKEHVPPYLAKTFVMWPFYMLLHVGVLTTVIKKLYERRNKQLYDPGSLLNRFRGFRRKLTSNKVVKWVFMVFTGWIFINTFLTVYEWLSFLGENEAIKQYIEQFSDFLKAYHLYINGGVPKLLAVLYIVLLFPDLRRLLIRILSIPFIALRFIPGKKISSLLDRYLLLGKFALHKDQARIFDKLKRQYPPGTGLVVLPMDMEQMGAGKVAEPYLQQLQDLKAIKAKDDEQIFKPFVFVDPRRIRNSKSFFNWTAGPNHEVQIDENCEIYDCMINHHFSGFKIYPALGYYPFDHALLPLWKYAADHQIPIMSHTIRGTIFYRGKKDQPDWHAHPILKKAPSNQNQPVPIRLDEKKNIDWTVNFTHPLNFLCLLSEQLLRIHVGQASQDIKDLFGYNGADKKMDRDLSELKICMAHFGGEDEWVKYLEKDRYYYAQQLIQHRNQGLQFIPGPSITSTDWNRLSNYWSYVDWHSIICSLMIQYPNVYADISYILSKPRILPLLKETLDPSLNPKLRKRVLYGTDFYVVRNHFSEKDLLAQMRAGLSEDEFDLIARHNPQTYL